MRVIREKIKLQLDAFPVSVWLAADTIELGTSSHRSVFKTSQNPKYFKLIQEKLSGGTAVP